MDPLDKLLLEYLPDTGLCARGRRIQADRRERMKAAILMWALAEAIGAIKKPVPNFVPGGTASGNLRAVVGEREGPELIIDEMQMELASLKPTHYNTMNPPIPPPDRHLPSLAK